MIFFQLMLFVFWASFALLTTISLARIYSKAGWSSLAVLFPVYNLFVFLNLIGKPRWWILMLTLGAPAYIIDYFNPDQSTFLSLFIVTLYLVQFAFGVWAMNILAKCFGKEEGFTVGLVLLTPIFLAILAFDGSEYIGPIGNWREYDAYNREKMNQSFDFEGERRDKQASWRN